jgi:hypothetical protein
MERNAKIWHQRNKAFIVSTRKIQQGEEIYLDYGNSYWNIFLKENQNKNNQ